jgi:hypothetical protein
MLEFESDAQTTGRLRKEILLPILQRYRVCPFLIWADEITRIERRRGGDT